MRSRLLAFDASLVQGLSLDSELELLSAQRLRLTYRLSGAWPALTPSLALHGPGQRRDELWRQTCFECFVSASDSKEYVELNVSSTGDWALYHFDDYRQGMRPLPTNFIPQWRVQLIASTIVAQIIFELPASMFLKDWRWRPAVIAKDDKGLISYWSHSHGQGQQAGPDFHRMSDGLLFSHS